MRPGSAVEFGAGAGDVRVAAVPHGPLRGVAPRGRVDPAAGAWSQGAHRQRPSTGAVTGGAAMRPGSVTVRRPRDPSAGIAVRTAVLGRPRPRYRFRTGSGTQARSRGTAPRRTARRPVPRQDRSRTRRNRPGPPGTGTAHLATADPEPAGQVLARSRSARPADPPPGYRLRPPWRLRHPRAPALETVVRDPSHAARRPALGSDSNGRHALRPARRFRQLPCGDDGEATPNARQGVADRHLGTGIHPARGALSVMARTVREPVNAGPARLHRVHRRSLSTRGTGPETGPLPRSRSGTAVVSGSRTAVQTGPANRAPGRGPVPDRDRTGTSPFGGGTAVPRASPVQVPAAVPVPGSMPVPRGQAGGPVRTGTVVLRQALRPRRPAPAQGTIRHSRRAGRHVSGHPLTKG